MKLIDGRDLAKKIRESVKNEVINLKQNGIVPGLAVVIAGDDPASQIYVNLKKKACEEVGIYSEVHALPTDISQNELLSLIEELNKRADINGILIQHPLPKHLDEKEAFNAIAPEKDADGFNPVNVGKLCLGEDCLLPCTPAGVMEMLKDNKVEISGKNCVVVGRSNIVGKPLALLLLKENATVTICHSKTVGLKDICKGADILIAAVGRPKFITKDMVKPGAVVIDVGINRLEGTKKIEGDVDFEEIKEIAQLITPVPGGVGPMTIAMLLKNTLKASKNQLKIEK